MKVRTGLIACVLSILFAACAQATEDRPTVTALWHGNAPDMANPPSTEPPPNDAGSYVEVVHPTLSYYPAANPTGAAILILPGGSYKKIVRADSECADYARWFNTLGIDAFVLKYRLPMDDFNPPTSAYQDAQRAIRLIRGGALSGSHHIDANRVGVIGFSAGGHLAAVVGTYYATKFYEPIDEYDRISARPNFMVLGAAPILSAEYLRRDVGPVSESSQFRRWFAVKAGYPIDRAINADTPATFLFHGDADKKVPPSTSINMAAWLDKAHVPVELHMLPGVGHDKSPETEAGKKLWKAYLEKWLRGRGIIPPAP